MTESEWLNSDDWLTLWWHLRDTKLVTERRMRLLAVAACRRIAYRMTQLGSVRAIAVAEWWADGLASEAERIAAHQASRSGPYEDIPPTLPASEWAATRAASWVCHEDPWKALRAVEEGTAVDGYEAAIAAGLLAPSAPVDTSAVSRHAGIRNGCVTPADLGLIWQHEVFQRAESKAGRACALLLRDIFGNPFRPVNFSVEWRTDTAVAIARQMYDSRDFGTMPILADALQDAGCDSADILNHCRQPGEHVRGCWVIDLVLDKA